MKPFKFQQFRLLAFSLLLLSSATAQKPDNSGGPLVPFSTSLRSRGVETSRPSLIAALHNPDPEIRSLAALQLSENHDFRAIASIESALSEEKDLRARIDIASALWTLQDPQGLASLKEMCPDPSLPIGIIVDVVQKLNMLNESGAPCVLSVLHFVDSNKDTDSRSKVLPALPHVYRWASPIQRGRVLSALESMLQDQAAYVRIEAGHALVEIGSPLPVEALRRAVLTEADSTVRSSMARDLRNLENRH